MKTNACPGTHKGSPQTAWHRMWAGQVAPPLLGVKGFLLQAATWLSQGTFICDLGHIPPCPAIHSGCQIVVMASGSHFPNFNKPNQNHATALEPQNSPVPTHSVPGSALRLWEQRLSIILELRECRRSRQLNSCLTRK